MPSRPLLARIARLLPLLLTILLAHSVIFASNPMNSLRTILSRRLPLFKSTVTTATTTHRITTAPRAAARPFSTTTTTAAMSNSQLSAAAYLDHVRNRRTYYALSKDLAGLSTARVEEIVQDALKHVPSSFNSQSNRVVVLFGAEHDKLWDITSSTLKAIVPEASWDATAARLAGFKGGAASILFFEDTQTVKDMQAKFAIYADRFPPWAGHTNAMLQHVVWTALEAEGLGANLQHYNPLIDAEVAKTWSVPESWQLTAQLVVGGRAGPAGDKTFLPLEERYKSFGA